MSDSGKIELAELVAELRSELLKAEKGRDERLRLRVEDIELEIELAVTKEISAEGKVGLKFWVFSHAEAGAGVRRETVGVQRLKLKIQPVTDNGGNLKLKKKRDSGLAKRR